MDEKDEKDEKKVKAAKARAKSLSKSERSEIAKKAAEARWQATADLPRATHGDADHPLKIGDTEIQCYVLDGGLRVLSGRGMQDALALGQGHGGLLKEFLSRNNLKPFIGNELAMALEKPIRFIRPGRGGVLAVGYEATILADICDCVLAARKAGVLTQRQLLIAEQCEILARAFARVGIIALVDEATGFQHDRARNALAEILEAFIARELKKWVKTFPDEYYKELFRLKNKPWPFDRNPPQYVGHWTNNLVYSRLAPGVLDELQRKTPKTPKGNRKHRFHQWLTDEVGDPKLQEHFTKLITLMQSCDDWDDFEKRLNRVLPKHKEMPLLAHLKDEDFR